MAKVDPLLGTSRLDFDRNISSFVRTWPSMRNIDVVSPHHGRFRHALGDIHRLRLNRVSWDGAVWGNSGQLGPDLKPRGNLFGPVVNPQQVLCVCVCVGNRSCFIAAPVRLSRRCVRQSGFSPIPRTVGSEKMLAGSTTRSARSAGIGLKPSRDKQFQSTAGPLSTVPVRGGESVRMASRTRRKG